MKQDDVDTLRNEYDCSRGVRGKHHRAYRRGTNVVLLDPEVAEVFKDPISVNKTLRAIAQVARAHAASISDE